MIEYLLPVSQSLLNRSLSWFLSQTQFIRNPSPSQPQSRPVSQTWPQSQSCSQTQSLSQTNPAPILVFPKFTQLGLQKSIVFLVLILGEAK